MGGDGASLLGGAGTPMIAAIFGGARVSAVHVMGVVDVVDEPVGKMWI